MPIRIVATCLLLLAFIVPAGCKKTPAGPPTPDVEIAQATDDGAIDINRDSMPRIVGFCWGRNATGAVGLPNTGGQIFIWRTLFRFDLSGWSTGDAEFYFYCTGRAGTAPNLEAVAVADFDSVPYRTTYSDVSALWNLVDDTGWVHFTVPSAQLQSAKSATGYLGLVVKAASEQIVPGNQFDIATWEAIGFPKPFLAW